MNNKQVTIKTITPKPTDRSVFIGQTGSGKTTLAHRLLRSRYYVWAIDVNGTLDWDKPSPEYPEGEYLRVTSIDSLIDNQEYPKLIFTPGVEEQDNFDLFNQFFKAAFLAEQLTVYVDEAYAVTNRQVIPPYYRACLTRGRARGIETWTSTQRPAEIPAFILSESENVYVFKLRYPPDLQRIEKLTEFSGAYIRQLPKRQFCYTNGDDVFYKLQLQIKK